MGKLVVLFRLIRFSNIPALLFFLFARVVYQFFGIKMFSGISLTFANIALYLRADFPSGLGFIKELIADDTYSEFHEPPGPGNVLLDIGANIGLLTLSRCLRNANLKAFCLEPHPETFSLLKTNVELNRLSQRVNVYNCAASDHGGTIGIVASGQENMAKTLESGESASADVIQIPCWTLDAFCSAHNIKPTLLKIDVEGHEVAVLIGAEATLRGVTEVVVECHSNALLNSCRQLLGDQGFATSDRAGLLHGRRTRNS